jgi:hypothetical protein
MMFTETQVLLRDLAKAGGEITFLDDEEPYSTLAMKEAKSLGLVRIDAGNGWGVSQTLELTKAGKLHCGIPVPPTLADRLMMAFKSWLPGTKYSR